VNVQTRYFSIWQDLDVNDHLYSTK